MKEQYAQMAKNYKITTMLTRTGKKRNSHETDVANYDEMSNYINEKNR